MIANVKHDKYSNLLFFGEDNKLFLDKVCAVLLAFTPILQHYVGIVEDMGITLLLFVLPWIMLRLLFRVFNRKLISVSMLDIIVGLLFFIIYRTFVHEISFMNLIYNMVLLLVFISAAIGCINIKQYLTTAYYIAIAASICIIMQYICYYIFGFHLQLVPTSLLLPEADQWILGAKTGLAGITGRIGTLYRPSAFFLEPSHMFLFLFPHIFMVLYSPNMNRHKLKMAILLSVGLMFTTSGMGLVTLVCAWGGFFVLSSGKKNKLSFANIVKAKNVLFAVGFLIIALCLFIFVPFVRNSVMRFLDSSNSGAIAGRTRLANQLLYSLSGKRLIFGVTNTLAGIEFNMSGFAATLYKFGIIGVILSYSVYIIGFFRLKKQYFWICMLVVAVSFFSAQTHGTFYMMYYVFFILEGNYYSKRILNRYSVELINN